MRQIESKKALKRKKTSDYWNNKRKITKFKLKSSSKWRTKYKIKAYAKPSNTNLDVINNTTLPNLTGFNTFIFNETLETFSIIDFIEKELHVFIDNNQLDYTITSLEIPNIEDVSYPVMNQSINSLYYLAWTTPPFYNHFIAKIDPITGNQLERVNEMNLLVNSSDIDSNIKKIFYPNPFDNQIDILQDKDNRIKGVFILDKLGNTLLTKKSQTISSDIYINTSVLTKGIYFIRITYKDGTSVVKQIIKE